MTFSVKGDFSGFVSIQWKLMGANVVTNILQNIYL